MNDPNPSVLGVNLAIAAVEVPQENELKKMVEETLPHEGFKRCIM